MSSERKPLHAQVEQALRERLRARDVKPGSLLPSEAELQHEFDVSRSVVRQALATLEADGLIRKVAGRGSVVAEPVEVHRNVLRPGLTVHTDGGGAMTTRVTAYDVVPRPEHLTSMPGGEVLQVERLRSVDGEPLSVIRTWLPVEVADAIAPDDLANASLHDLLAERLGWHVTGGNNQVRAVAATERLAGTMGVAVGAPLLLLEGQSLEASGRVVETFSTWHRGDLAAFDVVAAPAPADEGNRLEELARTARELVREIDVLRRS